MAQATHVVLRLPPNFKAIPSRSRQGEFSYLDEVTQKRYMTVEQTWEVYRAREGAVEDTEPAIYQPTASQLQNVQSILAEPERLGERASAWFDKFDTNCNGELDKEELGSLMFALNSSLGIPEVDTPLLSKLLDKFDLRNTGTLNAHEFFQLYKAILRRIRDRFIKARIGKQQFLCKQTGKPQDKYDIQTELGKGSFGVVYQVQDKTTHHKRVMKVVNKTKTQIPMEAIEQEIETLKNLDHPHIIRLFETFEDAVNIYFIMDLAKGGELLKVLAMHYERGFRLNEKWLQVVMKQCLQCICYVHANKIIHKDLKCENIMLLADADIGTPHIVIIDLGLAEMFAPGGKNAKIGGTPVTMAPEVWRGAFSFKCDIWSLGVVLFQLLSGHLPFLAQSINPSVWLALHQRGPNWERLRHCSNDVRSLVSMMLRVNAELRPAGGDCLEHSWFASDTLQARTIMGEEHIKALKDYSKRNDLEKAVMLQVASQLSTSSVGRLNEIFAKVDTDHSGSLDRNEFVAAMKELGVDKKHAQEAYMSLDLDGSGQIEYTEFVAGCMSLFQDQLKDMLWQAFSSLDVNHDNELSVAEVGQLLNQGEKFGLGTTPDTTQIQQMIAAMDTNKSGSISFSEFENYFLKGGRTNLH